MTQTSKLWDKWADGYAKRPIADEETYQKKLKITQSFFTPDSKVLEFACGTGTTALIHAPYVKHIYATDVSPRMIEICKEKLEASDVDNVTFECAPMDELDIPEHSIDVVLAMSILHLLDDRDDAIAKVKAMLKPDGVFVSSTVCLGDHLGIFKIIAPIGRMLGVLPLLRVFKVVDLEQSLINAGFEIEQSWQSGKNTGRFIVARKT